MQKARHQRAQWASFRFCCGRARRAHGPRGAVNPGRPFRSAVPGAPYPRPAAFVVPNRFFGRSRAHAVPLFVLVVLSSVAPAGAACRPLFELAGAVCASGAARPLALGARGRARRLRCFSASVREFVGPARVLFVPRPQRGAVFSSALLAQRARGRARSGRVVRALGGYGLPGPGPQARRAKRAGCFSCVATVLFPCCCSNSHRVKPRK
jgi:hypothetical protein